MESGFFRLHFWILLFSILALAPRAHAQSPNPFRDILAETRVRWHLAGLAEARGDWNQAIEFYDSVSNGAMPLPLSIREWYRGSADYGRALCSARLSEQAAVRNYLAAACRHHFWNFDLLRSDSSLVQCCGRYWIDSLEQYWKPLYMAEQSTWSEQSPIILRPDVATNQALPIIIALHGGNGCYREFAEYWRSVSNEEQVMVVIPPGHLRESEITNSWGDDMRTVEQDILDLVKKLCSEKVGDSSNIFLAGYSQGAQAALEVGIKHPMLFRGIIPICGFVHQLPDSATLRLAAASGLRVYAISPALENHAFDRALDSELSVLHSGGVEATEVEIEEMVHEMPLDLPHQFVLAWTWLHRDRSALKHQSCPYPSRQTSE